MSAALRQATADAKAREQSTRDLLLALTGTVALHHRTGIRVEMSLLDKLVMANDAHELAANAAHEAAMAELREAREALAMLDARGHELAVER